MAPAFDQATDHAERISAIETTLRNIEPKIDEMYVHMSEQRGAGKLLHWSSLIFGGATATAIVSHWSYFLSWLGSSHH